MIKPQPDNRTPSRRASDERIASEPPLDHPDLSTLPPPTPVEDHLARARRPFAVAGRVENGLVRPLDPNVKLPEHARVVEAEHRQLRQRGEAPSGVIVGSARITRGIPNTSLSRLCGGGRGGGGSTNGASQASNA